MSPSHYVALYDLSLGLSRQFAVRAALTAVTLLSVHIFRFSVSSNRCVVRNRSVFMLATTFVAFVPPTHAVCPSSSDWGDSWRCIWVFLIIHLDSKATQAVTAPLTQLGTGDCQVVPMFWLVV